MTLTILSIIVGTLFGICGVVYSTLRFTARYILKPTYQVSKPVGRCVLENTKKLSKKAAKINFKDSTSVALVEASSKGNIEIVKFLLKKGTSINTKDENGDTVLSRAVCDRHIDIVRLLLKEEGLKINAKNKKGHTALRQAVCVRNIEMIELLLSAGAKINATDKKDRTVLDEAISWGYDEIVKLLLKEGAKINRQDVVGYQKLMEML